MKKFNIPKEVDLYLYDKQGQPVLFLENVDGYATVENNLITLKLSTVNNLSDIFMVKENNNLTLKNVKVARIIVDKILNESVPIESPSNDEYKKQTEAINLEIKNKRRYCSIDTECIKGAGCHDACIELDNPNVGMGKPKKPKGNYMNELLNKYGGVNNEMYNL